MLNWFGSSGKVDVLLPHWKREVGSSAEGGNDTIDTTKQIRNKL